MQRHWKLCALTCVLVGWSAPALSAPAAAGAPPAPPDSTPVNAVFTNATAVTIGQTIANTVTSTIAVSGANTWLTDVDVTTFITHSFPGDLDVTVKSPAGTIVTLTTDNGGGNANVFNGTVWDDHAGTGDQVPYQFAAGMVTDHQYSPNVTATPLSPEEPLGAFVGENPNGTWTLTVSDDLAGDGGSLDSWSLSVTSQHLAPARTVATATNSSPVPIPDAGVATSAVAVSGQATYLCDVNVQTSITHPMSGQLQFTVTSPAGTIVSLSTNNGGQNADVFNGTTWDDDANPGGQVPYVTPSSNNIASDLAYASGVVATSLTPEEPLAAFIGENPNGTWTLTVADVTPGGVGSIAGWGLTITTCPSADAFHALSPARLVDTRPDQTTIDGQFQGGGPIGPGAVLDITVVGRGGVPAIGVGAVALNVTATEPTASSFLTVYPTGAARPVSSNLNVVAGQTVPNMVVVPVGAGGKISVFNNNGSTQLVSDVLGWFPTGNVFTGLTPARLLDTRPDGNTIDGSFQRGGALGPVATTDVVVVGRGGVPASGVGAVALNVTATQPTAPSFLTVYPGGAPRPNASNVNFAKGQTVPNMVIVPVSADGKISVYNNFGSTHVVIDVLGWFPGGALFTGLAPARLLETRHGTPTIDGQFQGVGPVGTGATIDLVVAGRGGVPATGAGAVVLNVTATNATADTYLTVFPTGAAQPNASNLNVAVGATIANMVVVPIGAGGKVSLYNFAGSADVVIDVLGSFPAIP